MLKNLFKYEWKAASRMMLAVHGLVLLVALLTRVFINVMGGLDSGLAIPAMVLILGIMAVASAYFFTIIFVGYRFYKSVFTDQGYLTNTLPVTQRQIIIGKGLVGVIWQVLDLVIIVAAILLMFVTKDNYAELGSALRELLHAFSSAGSASGAWLTLLSLILTPFATVLQLYFCVAIGNLFTGHKVLGAIGAFAVTYTVQQVVSLIVLMGTGFQSVVTDVGEGTSMQISYLSVIDTTLLISFMISLIGMVVYYMVTQYIMTKKMNLQ